MPTEPQSPISKVILYARSAPGEDDTRDRQLAAGRAWTQTQGGTVGAAFTEIASGNGACPELERAIQAAQAHTAALVCEGFDRLARNITLRLIRLEDCRQRGVPVFFTDPSQPREATQSFTALQTRWEEALGGPLRSALRWTHPQPKTAWVYLRLGIARLSDDDSFAQSAQFHLCKQHGEWEGLTVVGQSTDWGCLGQRQRLPGLALALTAAQSRAFDVLVAYKPDRLSQRADPFLEVLEAFRQASVEVQFAHPHEGSPVDNLVALHFLEQAGSPMETQVAYRRKSPPAGRARRSATPRQRSERAP